MAWDKGKLAKAKIAFASVAIATGVLTSSSMVGITSTDTNEIYKGENQVKVIDAEMYFDKSNSKVDYEFFKDTIEQYEHAFVTYNMFESIAKYNKLEGKEKTELAERISFIHGENTIEIYSGFSEEEIQENIDTFKEYASFNVKLIMHRLNIHKDTINESPLVSAINNHHDFKELMSSLANENPIGYKMTKELTNLKEILTNEYFSSFQDVDSIESLSNIKIEDTKEENINLVRQH